MEGEGDKGLVGLDEVEGFVGGIDDGGVAGHAMHDNAGARCAAVALDGEDFGAAIVMTLTFVIDDVPAFADALREMSAGSIAVIDI